MGDIPSARRDRPANRSKQGRAMTNKVPDWMYRQSAVIPYRHGIDGLEVLLITSRKRKRWVLPKGVVEPGMTPADSAAKEAFEEAGIEGTVDGRPLGSYRYRKWGGTCTVEVFAMRVAEETAGWPEADIRTREWVPLADAAGRVEEADLKRMIAELVERARTA
jgi:8-oxo-dGTP pyrophosphatase MutT (NUDIX family)